MNRVHAAVSATRESDDRDELLGLFSRFSAVATLPRPPGSLGTQGFLQNLAAPHVEPGQPEPSSRSGPGARRPRRRRRRWWGSPSRHRVAGLDVPLAVVQQLRQHRHRGVVADDDGAARTSSSSARTRSRAVSGPAAVERRHPGRRRATSRAPSASASQVCAARAAADTSAWSGRTPAARQPRRRPPPASAAPRAVSSRSRSVGRHLLGLGVTDHHEACDCSRDHCWPPA